MNPACLRLARLGIALGLIGALSFVARAQEGPVPAKLSSPAATLSPVATPAALIDHMEAAVLAGDPVAYLAAVSRADPVFRAEQTYWANDLAENTPAEFEIELTNATPTSPDSTTARAELTMTWRLKGSPTERSVAFPARFRLEDTRWTYAGLHWQRLEGDGVVVEYEQGLEPAAREVARLFPAIRQHVETGFELAVPRPQRIKLYRTMARLQASISLSYTDPLGGWNEPGESIKLLPAAAGHRLEGLLAHEFAHVATFRMGDHAADMPWWVLEGVAELAAQRYKPDHALRRTRGLVRNRHAAGTLAPWRDIADFKNTPFSLHHLVYPQGYHMLAYISDRFGRAARNDWLRAMARGDSFDDATRRALGLPFDRLDRDWRNTLDTPPPAPDDDP